MTDTLDTKSIDLLNAEIAAPLAPTESATPGAVLRRAREARGQSIADIAQVIRFSARQIEALERDDYASLPGSTAVRGLVRNYAKLVKLDPTPLLAQLDPAVPVPEADVRPPANMGEADRPGIVARLPVRPLAIAAAIALAMLVAYWYSTLPADAGLMSRLRGTPESSAVVPPNPVADPAAVPVLAPTPAVVAPSLAVGTPAGSGTTPFVGLRLEFDERSWVEIRDASQKIIFSGEYPAGTRQNVEGKPPYQVWIGKASGVRLFMGERSIDMKPHTREEVARFTLE